jgi:hypothetical protein
MDRTLFARIVESLKTETQVAVYRFFMPVRVIAQGIYEIVHESDAQQQGRARPNDAARQPKHG